MVLEELMKWLFISKFLGTAGGGGGAQQAPAQHGGGGGGGTQQGTTPAQQQPGVTQQQGQGTTPATQQQQDAQKAAQQTPTPFPQAVPAGLPDFPSGWEPDEPVRPEVAARAVQLLPQLWSQGAGSTKQEQTGGRWITYQAQSGGGKKNVIAWRIKAAPASTTTTTKAPGHAAQEGDPAIAQATQPRSSVTVGGFRWI